MSLKNFSVTGSNNHRTSPTTFILSAFRKSLIVFCAVVLAVGVATQSPKKIAIAASFPSTSIANGYNHTCAIIDNGTTTSTTKCWGANTQGQLGTSSANTPSLPISSSSTPITVLGAEGATAITAGMFHTCAIIGSSTTSTTKCWGANYAGQLGNGTTTTQSTLVTVTGLTGAIAIDAGSEHTCAIIQTDTSSLIKCWGSNNNGQLGNGTTSYSSIPVTVIGVEGATAITAGSSHTCAIIGSGITSITKCWGYNSNAQLGNGNYTKSSTPVTVLGVVGATAIAAGSDHTCAIIGSSTTSTTKCWGYNTNGQLGNGTWTSSTTPVTVIDVAGATAITAGTKFTCAIIGSSTTSTTKCWGANYGGQLAMGLSTVNTFTPTTVAGAEGAVAITAGWQHTCAIIGIGIGTTSTTKCWGYNDSGQLGNGTHAKSTTPFTIIGVEGATTITAGSNHTCAIISSGTTSITKCWGYNTNGQLGNGTNTNSSTAVTVTGAEGATSITAGTSHTCAIIGSGTTSTTKCWGYNTNGQLGNGNTTKTSAPSTVIGVVGATSITAGFGHTCAIIPTGTTSITKCWGSNTNGQLGNGTNTNSSTPVTVTGAEGATTITAGFGHTCAIIPTGTTSTTKCWGYNASGQLGNGNTADSSKAVTVTSAAGATAIKAGFGHTCVIMANLFTTSAIKCWGYNASGQLGNDTTTNSLTPVTITGAAGSTIGLAAMKRNTIPTVSGSQIAIRKLPSARFAIDLSVSMNAKKVTIQLVTPTAILPTDQIVKYLIQLRPAKGPIVSKGIMAKPGATVRAVLSGAKTTTYTVRVIVATASGAIRAWTGPTLKTS